MRTLNTQEIELVTGGSKQEEAAPAIVAPVVVADSKQEEATN